MSGPEPAAYASVRRDDDGEIVGLDPIDPRCCQPLLDGDRVGGYVLVHVDGCGCTADDDADVCAIPECWCTDQRESAHDDPRWPACRQSPGVGVDVPDAPAP